MYKEKDKFHRIPVLINKDQMDRVIETSKREGHSGVSSFIRWVLNNYINNKSK